MNKPMIPLPRILGIAIQLDYSWLLMLVLITGALATAYFPLELALPPAGYWMLGAITSILVLISVLFHELGHSVLALLFRVRVSRITLYVFGGGVDTHAEPPGPLADILVALAGPLMSLALAAAFGAIAVVSGKFAPLFVPAKFLALLNGSLALFNLIPGYPLDGGRVLRAAVWQTTGNLSLATRRTAMFGRAIASLLIVFGMAQALGGNLGGLWLALIAWLLQVAAAQQIRQQELADLLTSQASADVTTRGYVRVPAESTLQALVDQNLENVAARAFVVQRNGVPIGLLTWHHINAVPRASWRTTPVAQAMTPLAVEQSVRWGDTQKAVPVAEPGIVVGGHHPA